VQTYGVHLRELCITISRLQADGITELEPVSFDFPNLRSLAIAARSVNELLNLISCFGMPSLTSLTLFCYFTLEEEAVNIQRYLGAKIFFPRLTSVKMSGKRNGMLRDDCLEIIEYIVAPQLDAMSFELWHSDNRNFKNKSFNFPSVKEVTLNTVPPSSGICGIQFLSNFDLPSLSYLKVGAGLGPGDRATIKLFYPQLRRLEISDRWTICKCPHVSRSSVTQHLATVTQRLAFPHRSSSHTANTRRQ
jgi:hypothetical protein